MKLANGILAITLALVFVGHNAGAQTESSAAKPDSGSVETLYLTNVTQANDAQEIVTALRNLLDPHVKIFLVQSQSAVVIHGAPDQLVLAQKLINDLDRPKRTYRLTYTITEMDGGKRVGTQHFALIVVSGQKTTLKQGSKVPVVTGTFNSGSSQAETQVTYLDVGLNIDAALEESANGVRLQTKAEQSSIAEERSALGTQDPMVRQTVLEGTSILTAGKPLVLGSLDIPGSTRHQDIEVVMEVAR